MGTLSADEGERGASVAPLQRSLFPKSKKKKRTARPESTMSIDVDLAVVSTSDDERALDDDHFGDEHNEPQFSSNV